MPKAYVFLKKKYDLLITKKYTTVAGTLVFFLIMSIMPFAFWLTLLVGKLPIDFERILDLPVFESVKDILLYVRKEAETATASVSIVLLITTLYSSSNLFYQMRKSGEIIYDYRRKKRGIKVRIGAFVLLLIVMTMFFAFFLLFMLGTILFSKIFPTGLEQIADYLLLTILSFFLVLLMNAYVCPYKKRIRDFVSGTIVTVILWVAAVIGFSVYVKISNMRKLYGALSTIIVFLLWLYVLMICFIVGVIMNSEHISKEYKRQRRKAKRINSMQSTDTLSMKKTEKMKSSGLVGIFALLLTFSKGSVDLKEITKPYLGVYTCTNATFSGQKQTSAKNMKLELKQDNSYTVYYYINGKGVKKDGKYVYEQDTNSIRFLLDGINVRQQSFPIKKGVLEIRVQFGENLLELLFEK